MMRSATVTIVIKVDADYGNNITHTQLHESVAILQAAITNALPGTQLINGPTLDSSAWIAETVHSEQNISGE